MAIESELKLRLTPDHLARLRRHPLFKKHQISAPVTHRLHNIYFDTPSLDLHQGRMALRLRRYAGRWLQTLKAGGRVMAGLHQRNEWEVPVSSEKLDFSKLPAGVVDAYLPQSLQAQLRPVFITDFIRTSREIDWHGAVIEVCMDHGDVRANERCVPICEVELELKSGDAQQLFALAQSLLVIVPFELEIVSKAEQGFRLLAGLVAQPVKSELPALVKSVNLTDALQTLIWSCLSHLQGNLGGVMNSVTCQDAEYLHQMRVAIRRLRVVLRMAEKIHANEELAGLRAALSELCIPLGQIREWDVLIARLASLSDSRANEPDIVQRINKLMTHCEQEKAVCYAALHTQTYHWQQFLLRLACWMNGTYWANTQQGAPALQKFATQQLHQLACKFAKTATALHKLEACKLHALRIRAKTLRYSAEFFSSLYDGQQNKPYLAALAKVQVYFGEINDIYVANRQFDELAINFPEHGESAELIKAIINAALTTALKSLSKSINVFGKQKPFWEK
jgi:inorganic triphosphatase YgiF